MRLHITGANGFLASYIRESLGPGHELDLSDVDTIDVTDLEAVLDGIHPQTDLVCHLAGLTGAAASARAPERYFSVNATGTLNVLEACRRHGIGRFLFMSTLTVHGESQEPVVESSRIAPRHPYAASKAAAEMMVTTYARSFGLSTATLRATLIAGEGQVEPNAVSEFAELARRGEPIEIYGDGGHQREWLHPEDLGLAVLRTIEWLERGQPAGADRFIISSRSPVSMAELARRVIDRVGAGELIFSHPTFQAFSLTTDSTEARDRLDWEAHIQIDEIIDRVVRSLESADQDPGSETR